LPASLEFTVSCTKHNISLTIIQKKQSDDFWEQDELAKHAFKEMCDKDPETKHKLKEIRKADGSCLRKFDLLFSTSHSVNNEEVGVKRSTRLGGVCTVLFGMAWLVGVLFYVLQYTSFSNSIFTQTLSFLDEGESFFKLLQAPWLVSQGGGNIEYGSFSGLLVRVLAQGEIGKCSMPLRYLDPDDNRISTVRSPRESAISGSWMNDSTPVLSGSGWVLEKGHSPLCEPLNASVFFFSCPKCDFLNYTALKFHMHYR